MKRNITIKDFVDDKKFTSFFFKIIYGIPYPITLKGCDSSCAIKRCMKNRVTFVKKHRKNYYIGIKFPCGLKIRNSKDMSREEVLDLEKIWMLTEYSQVEKTFHLLCKGGDNK
jgi:hypothetical protein